MVRGDLLRDKARLEALARDAGRAINANNGQCPLIENVLCRVTTLCVELLADIEEREYLEHQARQEDLGSKAPFNLNG